MGAIGCNEVIRSWWFLALVYLIDSGDGQRRNEDINQLRRDVRILHQLTDNIQHEMKLFYNQEKIFSEDFHAYDTEHHTKKHRKDRLKKHRSLNLNSLKTAEHIKLENPTYKKNTFSLHANSTHQNFISENAKITNSRINSTLGNFKDDKMNKKDFYWPKFDDILRLANSKYDWKNDRWIKLKDISNGEHKNSKFNDVEIEVTKPRFRYSRVKINSGNSKRNIVIAISAMPKEN